MSKTIPLTRGRVAIVDDEDFEWLSQIKWHYADKRGHSDSYAQGYDAIHGQFLMHRLIMSRHGYDISGRQVDHRDGDGLNNIKSNLRSASASENQRNRGPGKNNLTGFKGVRFVKPRERFRAQIQINGRQHFLGYFDTAEQAARAYDRAARELHGEFAFLNFAA